MTIPQPGEAGEVAAGSPTLHHVEERGGTVEIDAWKNPLAAKGGEPCGSPPAGRSGLRKGFLQCFLDHVAECARSLRGDLFRLTEQIVRD